MDKLSKASIDLKRAQTAKVRAETVRIWAQVLGLPSGAAFGACVANWLYMRVSNLLLASAATPLPVTFSEPMPVKIPTPLQVTVSTPLPVTFPTPVSVHTVGGPPDWLIWWSFVISCVALGVAVITLIGVGIQIFLARKELNAVETDLENQREQMREFRRRPDLRVGFTNMVPTFAMVGSQRMNFDFEVMNQGSRVTTEFRVRFFFPETADIGSDSWEIHGKKYRAQEVMVQRRLYPGNRTSFRLDNVRCHESFEFLWEVDDDFGHYPPEGQAKLEIEVLPPTPYTGPS